MTKPIHLFQQHQSNIELLIIVDFKHLISFVKILDLEIGFTFKECL